MSADLLSNFHFMRPFWLLGFFALPLVWYALSKFNYTRGDWGRSIDADLLKHLTPSNAAAQYESKKNWPPIAVLVLAFIALAGPSWERKPTPVAQLQDDMVVILDLSVSMLATDVAPSRLIRSKQKLHDLLSLRSEGNTSLIVFSGDSHVVTPLTDDINTISSSLDAVDPFIMPVVGSRPDLAIKQAINLFEQNNSNSGRIVMISDGVTESQITRISHSLKDKNISLDVLSVGTKEGAPIEIPGKGYFKSQGEVVIPQTPIHLLAELANQNDGAMTEMSLDDTDLQYLDISGTQLRETKKNNMNEIDQRTFDTWIDAGYLVLILLIPTALFAYRQNTLLLAFMTASLLSYNEPTFAFEPYDLFKTNDQKAQEFMNQGAYAEAAEAFESIEHKASAHYRAGNFEQASKLYNELESVSALYNKANSLAKAQKFDEAIQAYEKVLELEPSHEDASFNKELIENLKNQAQQNQQQDQNSQDEQNKQENPDNDSQDNSNSQQNDQQNNEDKSQEQQSKDANENGSDQNSSSSDKDDNESQNKLDNKEKEQYEEQHEAQPSSKPNIEGEDDENEQTENPITSSLQDLNEEEKQSYEQWMRRVPDDPSGLLRRKFEQQSYERRRKGGSDTLNEGEPVW